MLAGCAGRQDAAGITEVDVGWQAGQLETLSWTDGKEKQAVSLSVRFPDGAEVNYGAGEVKAFEGQAVRGRVADAITGVLGDVGPDVIDSLTNAVLGAVRGPP
jgi:hypothetical protein